ncbi:MAG: hypothetical protein Q9191_006577 [Dirinaria sp. TL-2023a]
MSGPVELTESVEFKSLPSGLHHVEEDLVYFIHEEDYAGISAFVNRPAVESERNAIMLAVGALVPLSYGRMGKSWKHAEGLIRLARIMVSDPKNTQPLEDFWIEHHLQEEQQPSTQRSQPSSPSTGRERRRSEQSSPSQPNRARARAISTASALAPPYKGVSSHHPALSLVTLLDNFGPLVFPLYRAALLRKRILLVGHAPVELACNFGRLSVLGGIPASVVDLIPLEPLPTRLRPLFSVGVHDLSILSSGSRTSGKNTERLHDPGYGWVACTTDDILVHKTSLYDTLITLPPPHSAQASVQAWPRLSTSNSAEIKATQRDYRRYRTLRCDLREYPRAGKPSTPYATATDPEASSTSLPEREAVDDTLSTIDQTLIEPQSWSALAYSSFMWWASAGENRTDLAEEADHDSALLRGLNRRESGFAEHRSAVSGSPQRQGSSSNGKAKTPGTPVGMLEGGATQEMSIIAYFHRLTALMFKVLAEAVDSDALNEPAATEGMTGGRDVPEETPAAEPDERENLISEDEKVYISSEHMARMGLDVWSKSDRTFVEEMVGFYWGRESVVDSGGVDCCGVRIL